MRKFISLFNIKENVTKFVFLVSIIVIIGCTKNIDIKVAVLEDSLSYDDDKFNSSGFAEIKIIENFVYLVDSQSATIHKLNSDLSYEGTFGRKGQGPNEFVSPLSICEYKDFIYIADCTGFRIMKYNKEYSEVDRFDFMLPFKLYSTEKELFVSNLTVGEVVKLYKMEEGKFNEFIDFNAIFDSLHIPSNESNFSRNFRLGISKEYITIVFFAEQKIILLDNDGKFIHDEFIYPKSLPGNIQFGQPALSNDYFTVPATSGDNDKKVIFYKFSYSGKCIQIVNIEEDVFSTHVLSIAVKENSAIFFDKEKMMLYKYRL